MASKAKNVSHDYEHFGECVDSFKRFVSRNFKGESKKDMLAWCERLVNAHTRSVFTHLDSCEREIERQREAMQGSFGYSNV